MERKTEKHYSTGEFAAYFGLKKDTLFYYDKIKLFCPAGVSENGYRFYTSSQIEPFWTLLSLRELNVPIKTLKKYFQNPNPEQLQEITAVQLLVVEQEIIKLQKIRRLLQRMAQTTQEAKTAALGQVQIKELPERFYLYSEKMEQTTETTAQHWAEVYDRFVRENGLMGTSYVGSVIAQADLEQRRFGRVDHLFAESPEATTNRQSAGTYAIYYHQGSYATLPKVYPQILQQIGNLGYAIAGDAYEEYLIAETATNIQSDFITKISIPICLLQKNEKPVLHKSYRKLQDDFFNAMCADGYDDIEHSSS